MTRIHLIASYLLACLVYVLFVVGYERHTVAQARLETRQHADHLSGHLWDISQPSAEQYVQLVQQAGHFRSINVFHDNGEPFVVSVDPPETTEAGARPMEELFDSLGLIREVQFREDIQAQDLFIGTLESVWVNRNVFVYLYAFLVLLLSLTVLSLAYFSARARAERRATARALSESRQRLESVVAGAPVILFGLDPDGVFTVCEGKGLERLEHDQRDFVGRKLEDVFGPDPRIRVPFERARDGTALSAVHTLGELILETSFSPVHTDERVSGVIGVSNDISALHHALDELRERDERMNQELELARSIQMALAPTTLPVVDGCEFGLLYVPSFELSGDLISFLDTEDDHVLRVVFADITGHGVAAALLSTMFKVMTDDVLGGTNHIAHDGFHQLGLRLDKHFPSGYFASAFYAELDGRKREFRYIKASQEPVLVFRDGQPVTVISEGSPPLGLFPLDMVEASTYPLRSMQLEAGDTVFFYTDGLIELWDETGTALERSEFMRWVEQDLHLAPQALADSIYARALAFAGTSQLEDDVAVFVIRITPSTPTPQTGDCHA